MYGEVFWEPVRKEVGRSDTRALMGAGAEPPLTCRCESAGRGAPDPMYEEPVPIAKSGEADEIAIGCSCIARHLQLYI